MTMGLCKMEQSNLLFVAGAVMWPAQIVQGVHTSKNGACTAPAGRLLHHLTILPGIIFLLKMLVY